MLGDPWWCVLSRYVKQRKDQGWTICLKAISGQFFDTCMPKNKNIEEMLVHDIAEKKRGCKSLDYTDFHPQVVAKGPGFVRLTGADCDSSNSMTVIELDDCSWKVKSFTCVDR